MHLIPLLVGTPPLRKGRSDHTSINTSLRRNAIYSVSKEKVRKKLSSSWSKLTYSRQLMLLTMETRPERDTRRMKQLGHDSFEQPMRGISQYGSGIADFATSSLLVLCTSFVLRPASASMRCYTSNACAAYSMLPTFPHGYHSKMVY